MCGSAARITDRPLHKDPFAMFRQTLPSILIPNMRNFLFIFLLIVTGCSGQQSTNQLSKIDTVKLFNPNSIPDYSGMEMSMFERAIAIVQQHYAIILNNKETDIETLSEVESFIVSNKGEIKKDLFYILIDSATRFKSTISIIKYLTDNDISNYKVINIQKYFTPAEPVTIQTPTSVITTYLENDSTTFYIEILTKGFKIKLFNQEINLKDINALNNLIFTHKSEIKNINIITTKELPNNKFQQVIEVLKKHNYYRYNLVSKSFP